MLVYFQGKKSPPRHRASKITWKDVQDNRREAWRRSQKVLDEIEECFAKKAGRLFPGLLCFPECSKNQGRGYQEDGVGSLPLI